MAAHSGKLADQVPRVLTRTGVARLLGVTVGRVKELEQAGKLHPHKEPVTLVRYFERSEVLQLVRARGQRLRSELVNGPKAAAAFRAFENRENLAAIVIALEITPDSVRELYEQWLSLQASTPPDVPELTEERRQAIEKASEDQALELDADLAARAKARRERLDRGAYGKGKR